MWSTWSQMHSTAAEIPFRAACLPSSTYCLEGLSLSVKMSCRALCLLMLVASASIMVEVAQAKECDVCEKVVGDVRKSVFKKGKNPPKEYIEKKLESYCKFQEKEAKNQRGDKTKPSSMCYYLLPVKRQVSQPMANGVDAAGICKRLAKKDDQICALEFGEKLKTGKKKEL